MELLNFLFPNKVAIVGAVLLGIGVIYVTVVKLRARKYDTERRPAYDFMEWIGVLSGGIGLVVYCLSRVFDVAVQAIFACFHG